MDRTEAPPPDGLAPDGPDPRPVWAGRLFLGTLLALFALTLTSVVRSCGELRPHSNRGQQAPDFSVAQLDGGRFHLAEVRGHPVLVDFWATWCGPCKESLPILDQVYATYKDRGLRAIAVETEGAAAPARAFAAGLGLRLPIGLGDSEVAALYDVNTIPHLVLIDAQGRVVRVFHGVHAAADLGRAVEAAGLK